MAIKDKDLIKSKAFINGKWVADKGGKTFPVKNPANGQIITHVPDLGVKQTQAAIEAADKAWSEWRRLSAKQRAAILRKWYELMIEHGDDLATLLTMEQGKPLKEAKGELIYGASFVEWFGEEGKRAYGDVIPHSADGRRFMVFKQPIGVVGAITPWNFPIAMITRKVAPALAAGCAVVLKPAKETPLCALALAELAARADMPPGVLNIITSQQADEIGKALTFSPIVRKISFTGSTQVGKLLMQQSASTVKKISLELGGNAPFIVFEDADIKAAVAGTIASKFRNSGQTCICPNRILVQDSVYQAYTKELVAAVKKLKVGPGLKGNFDQGPLINQKALEKVEAHVKDAVKKGAKIKAGGQPHPLGGTFYEPTVLTEVTTKMKLAHEETFGPVAALFRFKDKKHAIELANATPFGLAGYFYSQDINQALDVAEALECGIICANTGILSAETVPFGGYKESGIGREGSKYGIDEYLEIKTLCLG